MVLSHEKEKSCHLWPHGVSWEYYAKWNKSEKDKHCMSSMFVESTKQKTHRYREEIGGCQGRGWWVGKMSLLFSTKKTTIILRLSI